MKKTAMSVAILSALMIGGVSAAHAFDFGSSAGSYSESQVQGGSLAEGFGIATNETNASNVSGASGGITGSFGLTVLPPGGAGAVATQGTSFSTTTGGSDSFSLGLGSTSAGGDFTAGGFGQQNQWVSW